MDITASGSQRIPEKQNKTQKHKMKQQVMKERLIYNTVAQTRLSSEIVQVSRFLSSKLNPRPRFSVSGKVCIVCYCAYGGAPYYNIYILDLASSSPPDHRFVFRRPTLRLECRYFGSYAFCVLGSTLFLFEGSQDLVNPKEKLAFSYDLSSKISNSSSLSPLCPMNYSKRLPVAVPTPDGKKILVFSTLFNHNYRSPLTGPDETKYVNNEGKKIDHDVSDEIDFELYDPVSGSWEELPGILKLIPQDYESSHSFPGQIYGFINDSTFLLRTIHGVFSLDLQLPRGQKCWKLEPTIYSRVDSTFVLKGDFVLTRMGVYDMKTKNPFSRFFRFPLRGGQPIYQVIDHVTSCFTLLGDDDVENNGECINFCVVQTAEERATGWPLMIVDVCSIGVDKYREDKENKGDDAELETCKLRTFNFVLDDAHFPMPMAVCIFPIRAGAT